MKWNYLNPFYWLIHLLSLLYFNVWTHFHQNCVVFFLLFSSIFFTFLFSLIFIALYLFTWSTISIHYLISIKSSLVFSYSFLLLILFQIKIQSTLLLLIIIINMMINQLNSFWLGHSMGTKMQCNKNWMILIKIINFYCI